LAPYDQKIADIPLVLMTIFRLPAPDAAPRGPSIQRLPVHVRCSAQHTCTEDPFRFAQVWGYTAGNSLLGVINDILDFSKIEAGKLCSTATTSICPPSSPTWRHWSVLVCRTT
jgi:hypothetical protein